MDKQQNAAHSPVTDSALDGFTDIKGTVPIVFPDEKSRPSLRTFDRWRKRGIVPSVKLGHMRYFNPSAVREALLARQTGGTIKSAWRNN